MPAAALVNRTSSITAGKALTTLLADKRLQRRSPQTIETYERNIGAFVRFYGPERPVDEIDAATVKAYAVTVLDRGVSDDTYAHYMREVKVFVRWLASEDHIATAPKVLLPTIHPRTKLNLVSDDDFGRLIATISPRTVWGLRDAALISLLYDSGARIGELLGLTTDDVSLEAGEAHVIGKGNRSRTIFYGDATAQRMHRYRKTLERVADPDLFFVSRSMESLNRNSAAAILNRARERSAVTCDVNPHNFRHSFATRFLRNGGNPLHLRRLLGHTSLKMTDWYVSLLTDDIKEAHTAFNHRRPSRRPR